MMRNVFLTTILLFFCFSCKEKIKFKESADFKESKIDESFGYENTFCTPKKGYYSINPDKSKMFCKLLHLYEEPCFPLKGAKENTDIIRFIKEAYSGYHYLFRISRSGDCYILHIKIIPPNLFSLIHFQTINRLISYNYIGGIIDEEEVKKINREIASLNKDGNDEIVDENYILEFFEDNEYRIYQSPELNGKNFENLDKLFMDYVPKDDSELYGRLKRSLGK